MKTQLITIIFTALIALTGCNVEKKDDSSSPSPSTPTTDYSNLTPNCFQASGSNPLITSGDFFTGSAWNDPSVLYENGQYVMYASADTNFVGDIKIYRLVSSDGITWTRSPTAAVLEKGAASAWDDKSVETPSVVKFNGIYHMFYTAYQTNTPTDFKIGHATSADGITWTKDPANPIVSPSGGAAVPDDFDQFITAEPGAVVFNNKLIVYFTGQGWMSAPIADQLMSIGYIESSDGSTFSAPALAMMPDQTIYPRSSNWKGHSTPSAVVIDNKVHLFVDVMYTDGSDTQRKLHHAVSTDGKTGWVNDSTSIFSRDDFAWTADEIRAPSVLQVGSKVKMWFAGHETLTLGIGLAECELAQ